MMVLSVVAVRRVPKNQAAIPQLFRPFRKSCFFYSKLIAVRFPFSAFFRIFKE